MCRRNRKMFSGFFVRRLIVSVGFLCICVWAASCISVPGLNLSSVYGLYEGHLF